MAAKQINWLGPIVYLKSRPISCPESALDVPEAYRKKSQKKLKIDFSPVTSDVLIAKYLHSTSDTSYLLYSRKMWIWFWAPRRHRHQFHFLWRRKQPYNNDNRSNANAPPFTTTCFFKGLSSTLCSIIARGYTNCIYTRDEYLNNYTLNKQNKQRWVFIWHWYVLLPLAMFS